jgi:dihydroorotase
MGILLKNLRIKNFNEEIYSADILIENGVIKQIGVIDKSNHEVVEMNGALCMPGFFDMHVHFREPGYEQAETLETGALAAANGGFTSVAIMPNTEPALDNAEMISSIKKKSEKFITDIYPIGAVTKERKGETLAPLLEMLEAGAVAFSDDGVAVKTSQLLRNALEYSAMRNAPIIEHCEDASLAGGAMNESHVSTELGLPPFPSLAEELIVARDILVAEYVGAKIHVAHVSTARSVELIRDAKKRGVKISAEVTPHHFTLTENAVRGYDTNFKMNPPLRSKADVDAILEALKDGTIDVIASDHAPHASEDKEVEFVYAPNGIIGLETEIGLAFTELYHKGILTLDDLLTKFVINPRKILNVKVPEISVGAKAELTFVAPDEVWTVDASKFESKSRNTPFDKKILTGKPLGIFNNGSLFLNGEFVYLN